MRNPRFVRLLTLSLITSILCTPGFAQAVDEEAVPDELPPGFVLPPRLRKIAFRDANPWTFHFNVRYNQANADVEFQNLGEVPSAHTLPGADIADFPVRFYDDGAVVLDSPRLDEQDDDGNQTSTPGGTYGADYGNGAESSFLAYTPGQTRQWGYRNESQATATPGYIHMNAFSSASAGASLGTENDVSGLGIEMAVARRLLRISEKVEVNLTASIGLTDIRAESSGRIVANLVTLSDVYQLFGNAPLAPYLAPTFENLFDDVGNLVLEDGVETTVPLQDVTADRRYSTTPDGALVDGEYELTGAYYSMRIGPQLRAHINDSFAVVASAGLLGAYVGTDYNVTETLDMGAYDINNPITITETAEHTELLLGYYAEVALEYWLTERTSIFLGAAYESIDDYMQALRGRTAFVQIGENLVLRVGLITRF
jgi:hypothetical protein